MQSNESSGGGQSGGNGQEQSGGAGVIGGMLKNTVSGLGDSVRDLAHSEIQLAKAELKQEATQMGKAGGMLAGSGVLGLTGFFFLMQGVVYLLARKLPMWVSASLVGSSLAAAAGYLGATGKTQLQEANLKPEQTIESLKDVGNTISGGPLG